ncbi:hypothetical protein [Burkholderia pseudomallei]|uniref:hypothetical protein n=1 Tax=Burkholderia pseudomallei TaxID=28450 RepID=UPI000490DED5|nr:hypothetical protein [Burkholderia pseudomallei]MBM5576141.1 hypothetical protein [Burkholderia pseudomallei]MBM5584237.1 hypothetical protein [Burkholderia pseudomallei]MBO2980801.1 hypothetical protein [Burkholderia pseudomallei]MBO2984955.1 hypothetical protein [Burkholderia pseudomallei]MBO7917466.1 hypothetical protein [Burkholderia pseudomallei]
MISRLASGAGARAPRRPGRTGTDMKARPMLEYALHPLEDRLVHVDELCRADPVPRGWARCPLCLEALYVVQLRDRSHARRFAHLAGEFARCPLVNDALPNPLAVHVGPPLDEHGRQARATFFRHWQRHLHTIRQTASAFGIARFMRAIELADVLKLWAWPTLAQRDIPYILLVLTEFIAAPRGERKQAAWSRFWFDASVQRVDDLRKPRGVLPRLFRLRYRLPRMSKFPNARHLIDCQPVLMNDIGPSDAALGTPRADIAMFEAFAARFARRPVE